MAVSDIVKVIGRKIRHGEGLSAADIAYLDTELFVTSPAGTKYEVLDAAFNLKVFEKKSTKSKLSKLLKTDSVASEIFQQAYRGFYPSIAELDYLQTVVSEQSLDADTAAALIGTPGAVSCVVTLFGLDAIEHFYI
jgi:hypothetical protein